MSKATEVKPRKGDGSPAGAQAVERAIEILQVVASAGERGLRLADVQRMTGLTKPTAHRLLGTLSHYRLLEQDPVTHRYHVGSEVRLLAHAAPDYSPALRDSANLQLRLLAQQTGDTVFLMTRSGYEVVCVDRHTGSYPIKALTGEIGTRRPLGVGASGTVLLSALPDDEVERVLDRIAGRLQEFPNVSEPVIRLAVREARAKGFAYSDGHVLTEVRAIGVPIRNEAGQVIAALSVAAIRERMAPGRIEGLLSVLRKAQGVIEKEIRPGSGLRRPRA